MELQLDHKLFQMDVMYYFLNHRLTNEHITNRRRRLTGFLNRNCGVLDKLETGTRNDKHHSGRRKRLCCRGPRQLHRNASGIIIPKRRTSSICSGCGVPLCSTACSKYYHEMCAKQTISSKNRQESQVGPRGPLFFFFAFIQYFFSFKLTLNTILNNIEKANKT